MGLTVQKVQRRLPIQEPKRNHKAKKSHEQHQRIFSEQFERLTGHCPVKQGF